MSTFYRSTFVKKAKVFVLVLEYFWSTQYSYSSTLKVLKPNSGVKFTKYISLQNRNIFVLDMESRVGFVQKHSAMFCYWFPNLSNIFVSFLL